MICVARYWPVSLALVAFMATGILGYMIIEGWSLLDAAYMTILTFTTVGYAEVRPLSNGGRIFTSFLMVGGVGTMLYILSEAIQAIVEAQLIGGFLRRRRMNAKLSRLSDHFIVCGFGRVGKVVAETFAREGVDAVVIDIDPGVASEAADVGVLFTQGDATDDDSLRRARIGSARGLVTSLERDSDNVFVALSARGMNPDLHIVARATTPENHVKLMRAGANRVISPHEVGGLRMAMSATRPLAVDFLDSVLVSDEAESLRLTEVAVVSGSPLSEMPIAESCAPDGVHVLAIRRGDDVIVNPGLDQSCQLGDLVVLLGGNEPLSALEGKVE